MGSPSLLLALAPDLPVYTSACKHPTPRSSASSLCAFMLASSQSLRHPFTSQLVTDLLATAPKWAGCVYALQTFASWAAAAQSACAGIVHWPAEVLKRLHHAFVLFLLLWQPAVCEQQRQQFTVSARKLNHFFQPCVLSCCTFTSLVIKCRLIQGVPHLHKRW